MADIPLVRTGKLTREQVAAIVGNNPRAIKLIENLTADVSKTLPEAVANTTDDAGSLLAAQGYLRHPAPAPIIGDASEISAVLAGAAFQHRPQPAPTLGAEADASALIATQVFGA